MKITVKVKTRCSPAEIDGIDSQGVLRVRLGAPPVHGKANRELIKLLSRRFRVAGSRIEILRGEHASMKIIEIPGADMSLLSGGKSR